MLARRFSCPPVKESLYDNTEVPFASKDMKGTVLVRPDRDGWLSLLGEMVQVRDGTCSA